MDRRLTTLWRLAIVGAMLAVLSLAAALTAEGGPDGDHADGFRLEAAPIDAAELLTTGESDITVVRIVAGIPSGCHSFERSDIVAADPVTGHVAIEVWNRVPVSDEPLACTAIYGMHELIVDLPRELDGRLRTVTINDGVTLDLERGPTEYHR